MLVILAAITVRATVRIMMRPDAFAKDQHRWTWKYRITNSPMTICWSLVKRSVDPSLYAPKQNYNKNNEIEQFSMNDHTH